MQLRPLLNTVALVFLLLLTVMAGPTRAADSEKSLKILLISSWSQQIPWQIKLLSGFTQGLNNSGLSYDLYIENLDSDIGPLAGYQTAWVNYLKEKYAHRKPDVIVAEDVPAANFLSSQPDFLPNAQRYYIFTDATPGELNPDQVLQLAVEYNRAMAEMIRLTRPERIFVVGNTDKTDEASRWLETETALMQVAPDLPRVQLVDLPLDTLLRRVAHLPENSVIFMLPIFNGTHNSQLLVPKQTAGLIAKAANAPIFTAWESLIGSGIVGGYTLSSERVGLLTAELVIKGTTEVSDLSQSGSGYYFDWEALKRWGLDDAEFFEDTLFLNRQPELLDEYRYPLIFGLLALLAWVTITITLLRYRLKAAHSLESFDDAVVELKTRDRLRRKALEEANRQAQQASEVKTRFINNMVMQIRGPLDAISGYLQLAQSYNNLPYKAHERIRKSQNTAEQLLNSLSKIQQYLSVDSGRSHPEIIPFDLHEWLDEVFTEVTKCSQREDLEFQLNWNTDRSPIIQSDPAWIRIVLENLLENAITQTQKGSVNLNVSSTDTQFHIRVSDTGPGIEPEALKNIYEPFGGLLPSSANAIGTSIGLPLCRVLIEHLGGAINIEKPQGKGTTVHLFLPVEAHQPPSEPESSNP